MTYHHEHGFMVQTGPDDWDGDSECCICSTTPCPAVTVESAVAHERGELDDQRRYFNTEIAYVLEHGHRQEVPF